MERQNLHSLGLWRPAVAVPLPRLLRPAADPILAALMISLM
jgi:hypothetical protein